MRKNSGIQKIKKRFMPVLTLGIFLSSFPAGTVFCAEPSSAVKKGDPKAEFEAMKAEWEKVRDQQIEMMREKEEQLEQMKENLFRQMQAAQGVTPVASPLVKPGAKKESADEEETPVSQASILGQKIRELKEANRVLANEVSTLKIKNKLLEERVTDAGKAASPLLQRERDEFESQKQAFLRERQKFFQEMSRQKSKLQETPAGSI